MICDRCSEHISFVKPINTCTVMRGWYNNELVTYVLCNECVDEIKKLLDGDHSGSGTDA